MLATERRPSDMSRYWVPVCVDVFTGPTGVTHNKSRSAVMARTIVEHSGSHTCGPRP